MEIMSFSFPESLIPTLSSNLQSSVMLLKTKHSFYFLSFCPFSSSSFIFICVSFVFWDRVSLCHNPGCPDTQFVRQAGLQNLLVSASRVLGSKARATSAWLCSPFSKQAFCDTSGFTLSLKRPSPPCRCLPDGLSALHSSLTQIA